MSNQPWAAPRAEPTDFDIVLFQRVHPLNPDKPGGKIIINTADFERDRGGGKKLIDKIIDEINTGTPYTWGYFKTTLEEYGVIEKDTLDPTKYKKKSKEDYMKTVKAKIKEKENGE
jgi:hypothetical protein